MFILKNACTVGPRIHPARTCDETGERARLSLDLSSANSLSLREWGMELGGGYEAGDRKYYAPLSDPYGIHGVVYNRRSHELDTVNLSRRAVLGLLDIRAQVEYLGDAQALEDCLSLRPAADVEDLSGAEEKAGLDGSGWGGGVGIAEVAQVEDAWEGDEGGLGKGFGDEGGFEDGAGRRDSSIIRR